MTQSEVPPAESTEDLSTMRGVLRFFQEALTTFQASSSKFRVIATARPLRSFSAFSRDDYLPPHPIAPTEPPNTLVILDSSFNPPTVAHQLLATSASWDVDDKTGRRPRILLVLSVNNADKAPKPASFDQRLGMMWSFARDLQLNLTIGKRGGELGLGGISVDIALSTLPYFHEKSQAISENEFYRGGAPSGGAEWYGRLRPRPKDPADQDQGPPPTRQVMLVGYDTIIRVFNPKYYRNDEGSGMQKALGPLFDRATLRVTLRPDDEWGSMSEQKQYIKSLFQPRKAKELGIDPSWESKIELVEYSKGWKSHYNAVSSTYARKAAKEGDEATLKKMLTSRVSEWVIKERLYQEEE
ncbi:nicotinamide mononucleotide adenylyltransferase [Podospora fimiseda]|uniref:Nicotinamide mononucleotide adenylyltransferase n=1 Tax=Podospora fimiseda TaxID=252190 RepID=A0AAN6YSJ3_9PEZI|nr:nicotinamide mononucleotide adenylyltransferase [Podospora fimiseda]